MGRQLLSAALVVVCSAVVAAVAMAGGSLDLFNGHDLHEGIRQGDTKDLRHGVTYQASAFPLVLRLRPPDARWGGARFESGRFRFVQVQHVGKTHPLREGGYITFEAAKGSTLSAARVIERLHATPHIDAGPITAARVGGFAGKQFDAKIVGTDRQLPQPQGISLAPFTKNLHCGVCTKTMHGETQDVKWAGKDQRFRIIVIGVRGKTVVIYVESNYNDQPKAQPGRTFPTFLPYAKQMLATVAFPH